MQMLQQPEDNQNSLIHHKAQDMKAKLQKAVSDQTFSTKLTFQSNLLNSEIKNLVVGYAGKDLFKIESKIKEMLYVAWKDVRTYPEGNAVISDFLGVLKPTEKVAFDEIYAELNRQGVQDTMNEKMKSFSDEFTKLVAFVIVKHADAFKNPAGDAQDYQREYVKSATDTVFRVLLILDKMKDNLLLGSLPLEGGSLLGSVSGMLGQNTFSKAVKKAVEESAWVAQVYKENAFATRNVPSPPLAAKSEKAKSEFFS